MDARDRWPTFAPRALDAGFRSVHALPVRFRSRLIGALNFYCVGQAPLQGAELQSALALADIATVAIVHHHALGQAHELNDQLQHALSSRVVIEQAKGLVAGVNGIDVDTAFGQLRRYARNHNLKLTEVSEAFVAGAITGKALGS